MYRWWHPLSLLVGRIGKKGLISCRCCGLFQSHYCAGQLPVPGEPGSIPCPQLIEQLEQLFIVGPVIAVQQETSPPPHAHVIHRSNQVWSCPPPRDCDKTAPQLLSRHTTHILDGNVHGFHASDSGSFLSPLQLIWLPAISQFPLSFCPHYTVGSVGRCDYLYSYPVTTVPGQCLGRCVQLYSLLVQSDNAVASWLHDHCSRVCLSVID